MSVLRVQGLSAGYEAKPVIQEVALEVGSGECLVLLGPNGSGKSTLLKAISGLCAWRKGEISYGDQNLGDLNATEVARLIAYVPQTEVPSFEFKVEESVRLGRLPHGSVFFDSQADLEAADEAMALADCMDLKGRKVTELSGGELQRVLLARALAQSTPILFLDEPTAHLDARHVADFVRVVTTLKEAGKILVFAAHDFNLARCIGDHAMLLDHGRAVRYGPREDVIVPSELEPIFRTAFRSGESGWIIPDWGASS